MGTFRFIDKYIEKRRQKQQEMIEDKKRINQLSETIDRIVNIDLFNTGKINKVKFEKTNKNILGIEENDNDLFISYDKEESIKLHETFNRIINIKLFDKPIVEKRIPKVNIIAKINIDRMNVEQLKNTYKFIKKSIKDSEQKNRLDDIDKLKELKNRIKMVLLEKSNNLDFDSIKFNIMYGDNTKLEYYFDYLLDCYNQYKNIKYDENAKQMRITILTLLKLIDIKKEKINQYVKKAA